MRKDKPLAVSLMKKYNRVSDEDASLGYDYYLAKYGDGVMVLPDRKGQTPESLKLLDGSVLEEIKKSGFIDKFKK